MVKKPATKEPLRSLSEGQLRQMLLAKQQELLASILGRSGSALEREAYSWPWTPSGTKPIGPG